MCVHFQIQFVFDSCFLLLPFSWTREWLVCFPFICVDISSSLLWICVPDSWLVYFCKWIWMRGLLFTTDHSALHSEFSFNATEIYTKFNSFLFKKLRQIVEFSYLKFVSLANCNTIYIHSTKVRSWHTIWNSQEIARESENEQN